MELYDNSGQEGPEEISCTTAPSNTIGYEIRPDYSEILPVDLESLQRWKLHNFSG